MILLAILAAAIIAAVTIATALLIRRTSINVVINKDPDMATIKQRLATLEASTTAMATTLASITASLGDHGAAQSGTAAAVDALAKQVDDVAATLAGIKDEIGDDQLVNTVTTEAPKVAADDVPAAPADPAPPAADASPAAAPAPSGDPAGLA